MNLGGIVYHSGAEAWRKTVESGAHGLAPNVNDEPARTSWQGREPFAGGAERLSLSLISRRRRTGGSGRSPVLLS